MGFAAGAISDHAFFILDLGRYPAGKRKGAPAIGRWRAPSYPSTAALPYRCPRAARFAGLPHDKTLDKIYVLDIMRG